MVLQTNDSTFNITSSHRRAFSIAGHIVSKKREGLQPAFVNMLVFLSEKLE